jgi:hypothetical protein
VRRNTRGAHEHIDTKIRLRVAHVKVLYIPTEGSSTVQALSCPAPVGHPSLPACFSRRCRRSLASRHTVVAAVVASRLATVAVAAAAFATVIVARLGAKTYD